MTSIDGVVDELLSKELATLSLKDQDSTHLLFNEIIRFPVKGWDPFQQEAACFPTPAPEESPEFLEAALRKLSSELTKIPDSNPFMAAYIESQILPETYVNTPDFRLRFLRCELFDAKKAAIRMVKFLDIASDLFGPVVLERPMRITDFTEEEKKMMITGNSQILPYRDQIGRPIFAWISEKSFQQGIVRPRQKLGLYLGYVMSKDIEAQQKGVALVLWFRFKQSAIINRFFGEIYSRFFDAIPLRWSATHWCLPDEPHFRMLQPAFAVLAGDTSRLHKFHYGKVVELTYRLKMYGIPVEVIPVTRKGAIKTTYLKQWMHGQKALEERIDMENRGEFIIVYPRSDDVLYRKGSSFTSHPGNQRLHSMIKLRMQEHTSASQTEKKEITNSIVTTVQQKGGRFLQWDDEGWWTEITDPSHIRTKVANKVKLFKFKPAAADVQTIASSTFLFQNQDNAKRRKIHRDDNSDSENGSHCACFF